MTNSRSFPLRFGVLVLAHVALCASQVRAAADDAQGPTGLQNEVQFAEYTPLSSSSELVRRFLSPLNAMRVSRELAHSTVALRDQPIDLTQERFTVYVPPNAPPRGYGVLVFVPPWENAMLPTGWAAMLDRHGVIFVSAARSGNGANVLDRREPLALLAAHNITRRYRVDPERIYIGGFSGGSRIALRLALGFPDVFRGAFLNAGSDPIGNAEVPLPPADLLSRFQEMSRMVYITGQNDAVNVEKDAQSERSLIGWCAFDLYVEQSAWAGHEVGGPGVLGRALDMLDRHTEPNAAKLGNCRLHLDQDLEKALSKIDGSLSAGNPDAARRLLIDVDTRYGGLAAPRSVDLAARIGME